MRILSFVQENSNNFDVFDIVKFVLLNEIDKQIIRMLIGLFPIRR